MKKLFRNIVLFLLPVLILVIILPVDNRLRYQGLKDDCFNHGIWIHDRIFNNPKAVDIAILGSSHTINGINDKLIEGELSAHNLSVANFGYCRLGRNFTYSLLKQILEKKAPQYLIIEVREDEDRYSHPIFPFISRSSDVILPNPIFNRDIISDIYSHLGYKVELTQDKIYKQIPVGSIRTDDFGFASSKDTASSALLDEIKSTNSITKPELSDAGRAFHMSYPRSYLRKIDRLCKSQNIKIIFLYLPSYSSHLEKPKEYKTYLNYGEVLIPPNIILDNPSYWHDSDHLNQTGAWFLSYWIAGRILELDLK